MFPLGKECRCIELTYYLHEPIVLNNWEPHHLEIYGYVQPSNGIAFTRYKVKEISLLVWRDLDFYTSLRLLDIKKMDT
jgi:hypothetical protein